MPIDSSMNTINSNFSTSFFRNFVAALSSPNGKTAAGAGATENGTFGKATISVIRDKFTLSHEGKLAHEKHLSKLDKKESSVQTVETQVAEVAESGVTNATEEVLSVSISQEQQSGKDGEPSEQFFRDLIAKYNIVAEAHVADGSVRIPKGDATWEMDKLKLIRTGDSGLTEAQKNTIDKVTLAKAKELWELFGDDISAEKVKNYDRVMANFATRAGMTASERAANGVCLDPQDNK